MLERDVDWAAVKADFAAGALAWPEMVRKHGVSQSTIERRARREGWTRGGRAKLLADRIAAGQARAGVRPRQAELGRTVTRLHRLVRRLTLDMERRLSDEAGDPAAPGACQNSAQMLNALTRAIAGLAAAERESRRAATAREEHRSAEADPLGAEAAWAEVERRLNRLREETGAGPLPV
jgi:hypothetical protein